MTALTHKEHKYNWTESCQWSFQELKKRLTTVPVLTIPQGSTGFAIYCDASKFGLGAVLMQHGKVVADALSRKSAGNVAMLRGISKKLIKEIVAFGLVIVSGKLSSLQVRPLILESIKEA